MADSPATLQYKRAFKRVFMLDPTEPPGADAVTRLTAREQQIVAYLAAGKPNKAGVPPVPPSPPLHPFLTGGRPRLSMLRLQGRAGAVAGLTPETASTPGLRATPPNGPPPLRGKSPIDAAAAHTPLLRASTW